MSSQKVLLIFVIVAALMNLMNYIFYTYNPTTPVVTEKAKRLKIKYRRFPSRMYTVLWSPYLYCENSTKNMNQTVGNNTENYDQSTYNTDYDYLVNGQKKINGSLKCPELPPDLGPISPEEYKKGVLLVESMHGIVLPGGAHKPIKCVARQNVAIIVPLSSNKNLLNVFVHHMHHFLIKQQLEYQIFVVKQGNDSPPFNRGQLYNVGYMEAQLHRIGGWDCFIFHEDIILPLDTRNLYRCSWYPRQLVASVAKPYKKKYMVVKSYHKFGSAIAMTRYQFTKVNGFSNKYKENDTDYDDLFQRLQLVNFTLQKNDPRIGKYATLDSYPQHNKTLHPTQSYTLHYMSDGLSTLSYKLKYYKLTKFYTIIEVQFSNSVEELSTDGTTYVENK